MLSEHRERFPRAARYHPDWVVASASGGANALWLAEWLAAAIDLRPIQLAATLYDDPWSFRRSVHGLSRGGKVALEDGARMPADRLPRPLTLCVQSGRGATFALHGWDNDDASGDLFANDFDDKGDDDELLVGFQRRFGAQLPTGVQLARAEDLEVRYRVTRGGARQVACPSELVPVAGVAGLPR
jgi:hypothetical protein